MYKWINNDPKKSHRIINHFLDREFGLNKYPNKTDESYIEKNVDKKLKSMYPEINPANKHEFSPYKSDAH